MDFSKTKYLDPKNDLTFRRIFGEHPNIMKSFLNSMLPLEEGRLIRSISYQAPAMYPILPELKHSIVDVKCTDNYGRQFIVEMQMYWTNSFKNRMLFNAGKAYVKQLDKGDKYSELCPVYGLSLLDQVFLKEAQYENQFYHHYKLSHQDIPEEEIKGIELIFIELPKFKPETFTEKKLRSLWLRFLTEIDENTENIPADLYNEDVIREALEHLQIGAFTKNELYYYEKYWDKVRLEKEAVEEALKKAEEGLERAEKERQRAEKERQRAEKESKRAERERERADMNAKLLEHERKKVEDNKSNMIAKLRNKGLSDSEIEDLFRI